MFFLAAMCTLYTFALDAVERVRSHSGSSFAVKRHEEKHEDKNKHNIMYSIKKTSEDSPSVLKISETLVPLFAEASKNTIGSGEITTDKVTQLFQYKHNASVDVLTCSEVFSQFPALRLADLLSREGSQVRTCNLQNKQTYPLFC